MLRMLRWFQLFLGVKRYNFLVGLLITTGFLSAILFMVDAENTLLLQTLLFLVFIAGALLIIVSRLPSEMQKTAAAILVPALGLVILGVFFLPHLFALLMGAAFGWIVAGMMIFGRSRAPMRYREAIKHLRKQEYKEASDVITVLIKDEPNKPAHYALRARIYRLWGKGHRARKDYEKILQLTDKDDPMVVVVYNDLSELELQEGDYEIALFAANEALRLAPDDPVAYYNRGMIQDRLQHSSGVIESLTTALDKKMRDKRHLLLIYLYLTRAYARSGQMNKADETLQTLKKQQSGLKEWEVIMADDGAEVLRNTLQADIETASALIHDEISPTDLIAVPT